MVRLLMSERSKLLGYVNSIVGSPELAEDIFQDVAVIALRKRGEVGELDFPGAWFRKIARMEALNAIRKRGAAQMDPKVLELLDAVWNQREIDGSLRLDGLRQCVQQLPVKVGRIVNMRYNQGIGAQEVAVQMEIPINTVYVYISRAHRLLRECIDRYIASNSNPMAE